jgi:TATA-box binding protein (TBP) (component of TFIID and TFIIIB)
MTMFEIKNVKISLKLDKISLNTVLSQLELNKVVYKEKNNYIIIQSQYIYIIFQSKNRLVNHINITKIPHIDEIDKATNHLQHVLFKNLVIHIISNTIDNLTSVYNIKRNLILHDIVKKIEFTNNISYNNEKFPGLFIKFGFGTLILFHTGKVIAVGCKKEHDLTNLFDQLLQLTKVNNESM